MLYCKVLPIKSSILHPITIITSRSCQVAMVTLHGQFLHIMKPPSESSIKKKWNSKNYQMKFYKKRKKKLIFVNFSFLLFVILPSEHKNIKKSKNNFSQGEKSEDFTQIVFKGREGNESLKKL